MCGGGKAECELFVYGSGIVRVFNKRVFCMTKPHTLGGAGEGDT